MTHQLKLAFQKNMTMRRVNQRNYKALNFLKEIYANREIAPTPPTSPPLIITSSTPHTNLIFSPTSLNNSRKRARVDPTVKGKPKNHNHEEPKREELRSKQIGKPEEIIPPPTIITSPTPLPPTNQILSPTTLNNSRKRARVNPTVKGKLKRPKHEVPKREELRPRQIEKPGKINPSDSPAQRKLITRVEDALIQLNRPTYRKSLPFNSSEIARPTQHEGNKPTNKHITIQNNLTNNTGVETQTLNGTTANTPTTQQINQIYPPTNQLPQTTTKNNSEKLTTRHKWKLAHKI
jgi:hypothetical protein